MTKVFDEAFRAELDRLLAWRRDVRRFRTDPVDEAVLAGLLERSVLSPSVGNSQPWRNPELVRAGWQDRLDPSHHILVR